jgi:hypothetical protein
MFQYTRKRSNPKPQRLGSKGFSDGWNSLPHASSLKDSELAELINGIYSQYGSISKRRGTQLVGEKMDGSTKVINGGMFYDIDGEDYMIRINDLGKVERLNFTNDTWELLTGNPPAGYAGTDPEFVDDSPVFDTSVFINIVQAKGKIYFGSPNDRVTIFDGTSWKVYVELADPLTRPTVVKTGAGTGTRSYFYRYVDLNEFGNTLPSPANDGGQSTGDGFYDSMPEIDGSTFLTITLPAPATGTTRRMLFRGDTAGNEFFLSELGAAETEYIDKNVSPTGEEGTSVVFGVPEVNTTPGYHFYLLSTYANSLVGTTVEEGQDTLVWSAGDDKFDSFALPDGAGFDGYEQGDGQTINALQAFSVANKDGLAVFKDRRMGLLEFDSLGGGNIQNVNVIRGTMSPLSPHVAGNNIRFYSDEGVASLGHEENYGTILRYSVMSLKADSVTRQVTPANLPQICSDYIQNLSLFGISTGEVGGGNDSVLVYDERYNTWSHWTGLHPSVFWKAIHPTTKVEELYFGVSQATEEYGGNVVKMFQGRTDYAEGTGTGKKITLSVTTKQYDAGIPDRFKKYDKAVLVFGSLFGNGTTVQAFIMGANGLDSFPRLRIATDPVLSGFGADEWGNQEVGMMAEDDAGETLLLRYINLRQKDLFWTKLNIQNDGIEDELTLIGIYFYYTDSARQLPSRSRLTTLA